jgi:hypothetical protein
MKPVVECLPAFFPPDVMFVSVEYGSLSLLQLMTNTLHALPVLQVAAKVRALRAGERAPRACSSAPDASASPPSRLPPWPPFSRASATATGARTS